MALPTREGRFKATIGEHAVNEVGPNRLAAFVCEYHLTQELISGQWVPIDQESFSITGYHFLEKRDGSVNDVTIDQLKEAFGWDGRDPFWLADTDFAGNGHVVQVKLGFEHYNGQQRIKVQFVNPENWQGGGVSHADDATRRSIQSRLSSRLRAHAGGSPANAPKPSNQSKPAAPAPASAPAPSTSTATAPPPSAPASPPSPATLEEAWEAFVQACPEQWDRARIEKEWFEVLGELVPDKQPEQFTPQDWGLVRDQGPGKITPF